MFFSYSIFREEGANGRTVSLNNQEELETVAELGNYEGRTYGYVSDEEFDELKDNQPEEIDFKKEPTLSDQIKSSLKKQRVIMLKKEATREKIEVEVGDLHDMIADCMNLIEFNIMLTSRLAADYFETTPLSPEVRETYKTRNQTFLDAVDSGSVTLRADFENPNELLFRLMERYSDINNIVKDTYMTELAKVGL